MGRHYDMIVIGAGISGLAMAFEAKLAGKSVLVLEKESRCGGCFHSATVDNEAQDFWLELGTHTCFNSYARLLNILKRLDMMDHMQARKKLRYRLWVNNIMCSIPSKLRFFELIKHARRMFSLTKQGKSAADYYATLVGSRNYNDVFQHALAAVLCQPVADVPADMLFRKRPKDKSIMRSYTFAGGLSAIIQALEKQLIVKTDQQIRAIDYNAHQSDGHYSIATADATYLCRTLVCATPALAASRLLRDVHPGIAEQLNWVNEVEIESVGVVLNKADLSLKPMAGVIAVDGEFYSAVSRDFMDHPSLRAFTFHFKPGMLSDDEKIQCVCRVLDIAADDLKHVFHKINRLPAPDMGHHQLIQTLDASLAGKHLALIGNYFDGVAVEDCLQRVEKELARLS